jgi:hypothetical protein
MICLRCGYCCLKSLVVIVKDPAIGLQENNVECLDGSIRCPHLKGNEPGKYKCAIHHYEWYQDTPCFQHGQYETKESNCRLGEHCLANEELKNTLRTDADPLDESHTMEI